MSRRVIPLTDIYESNDKYYIIMEMPGVSKENIDINVEDNKLIVKAHSDFNDKDWKLISKEFEFTGYERIFNINNKVKTDNINAKYENGLLTIELEKSDEFKPKKIEVKVG